MGKPHCLVTDEGIHEACLWRLNGFPADVIEVATQQVAQFVQSGIPLDSDQPEVRAVMEMLRRPNDRRNTWTAFCAIAALYADSQGYARLFILAGFEVITASRNAKARTDCTQPAPGLRLETVWPMKKAA